MALNFTIEFLIYIILTVLCLVIFLILFYKAINKNRQALFLFSFSILGFGLNFFTNAFAVLLMSRVLYILGAYALFSSVFFIVLFIDYTLYESFTAMKLIFLSIIGTLLIVSSLYEDSVSVFNYHIEILNGLEFPSFRRNGAFAIIFFLLVFIFVISVLYWEIKLLSHAPQQLKKHSKKILYAAVMYVISAFLLIVQLIIIYPISIIFTITGMIIIIHIIIKEPKILYILPFKPYRLVVIFKRSGVDLFSHKWESSEIGDDLIGGLMSAINKMGLELINQGELQYIAYEQGVFLMKGTEHLIFGLIVNKTSKLLNKCLNEFSRDFQKKFQSILENWNGELGAFKDADVLLEKHFGYIPSRIP